MEMSIADVKKTAEHKMQRSLEALKADLAKVRTGRAHTGLLDHVQVEYYGSPVPINTVDQFDSECADDVSGPATCRDHHGRQWTLGQ
jgi:ribosome recycling factor